jgi:hypothetical protein
MSIEENPSAYLEKEEYNMDLEGTLKEELKDEEKEKKREKNKKYNINFKNRHSEEVRKRVICKVCYGSYTYFNKSGHSKTIRHKRALEGVKEEGV